MVRDNRQLLLFELLHKVCGDAFRRVAVDHRFREMLREFFFQGLDIHDFHTARERSAELCDDCWLTFGGEIKLLQQIDADDFAVSLKSERERAHVHDAGLRAEAFTELDGDACANERAFEETEHVVVRQESADAGLLECNLVAVAHLLARAAFCHELLDFFRGAARRLVAHGVVSEDNFFAESRDAASLAVAPFAVRHWCGCRVECLFPFAAQVLLCRAGVNEIPREDFVLVAFAVDPRSVVATFFPDL